MAIIMEIKMENNKKLKESIEKDIWYTSTNYSNMYDRLCLRNNVSKFLIVYYSVIAIVNSILPKYIENIKIKAYIFDFSSVIISVILLVASLSVSLANYPERTLKAMEAIDKLKRMKKDLITYSEEDLIEDNYKVFKELTQRYHDVVDNMELRSNFDYYKTCKKLKNNREKFTIGECVKFSLLNIMEISIYIILIIAPIIFYFGNFI